MRELDATATISCVYWNFTQVDPGDGILNWRVGSLDTKDRVNLVYQISKYPASSTRRKINKQLSVTLLRNHCQNQISDTEEAAYRVRFAEHGARWMED